MSRDLTRECSTNHEGGISITASSSTTGAITCDRFAGGRYRVDDGASFTTITWYEKIGDEIQPCYDKSGSAITQTVATDRTYPIPEDLWPAKELYPVGDDTGTIYVILKG